ncbi:MAG: sigma-70 family RNA polymerase sigma factor [Ignavibacteria bacterium]|nr:sigma-70 family RNA polymerase sigma factor [Ignavibacteria bacterium]
MSDNKEKTEVQQQSAILSLNDDFALIRAFNDGNESAFRTLVNRHKEKVRNLIYVTIGNADAVDDISQEVFIQVYRKLKFFRFESQFTTWLYTITVNKCRDHIRKIKLRSFFSPLSHEDDTQHPAEHHKPDFDIQEIVQAKIALLPTKLRIPLVLRDFEGLSYQEISETLGTEVGTVKSRIFRARETLKKMLQPLQKELL